MHILPWSVAVAVAVATITPCHARFFVEAEHPPPMFLTAGRATLAPFAFVQFCVKNPRDCRASAVSADPIELSSARWQELNAVNATVNAGIAPRADAGGDIWSLAPRSGDCEDYALTKRHRLISLGWRASALRIAIVLTPEGIGHAVLVVRTGDGDIVLDNRTTEIRSFQQTDLTWIKVQSGNNPYFWNML